MTTQKEQTQDAKMIQLALYREYGFQPCLKDPVLMRQANFKLFNPLHRQESRRRCRILKGRSDFLGGIKSC